MSLTWKRHPDTSLHATGAGGTGPIRHYSIRDGKLVIIAMGRVTHTCLGTETELKVTAEDLDDIESAR